MVEQLIGVILELPLNLCFLVVFLMKAFLYHCHSTTRSTLRIGCMASLVFVACMIAEWCREVSHPLSFQGFVMVKKRGVLRVYHLSQGSISHCVTEESQGS